MGSRVAVCAGGGEILVRVYHLQLEVELKGEGAGLLCCFEAEGYRRVIQLL